MNRVLMILAASILSGGLLAQEYWPGLQLLVIYASNNYPKA